MERSRITTNVGLKLGSLAVAILLWFHIATEKDAYERTIFVPIQVVGIEEGLIASQPHPQAARVRFTGRGKRLLTLPFHDVRVVVDASGITSLGIRELTPTSVVFPDAPDLDVIEVVSPRSMEIHLDRIESRRLPIRVVSRIETAPGHARVGPVRAVPDSVTVIGPRARVLRLSEVLTDTLRVARARAPVDRQVLLQIPGIHNVSLSRSAVQVTAEIQQLGERTFPDVPVRIVGSPEGRYLAQPRGAAVTVSGGNRLLEELQEGQVEIILDLAGQIPDGLTPIEPRVVLPEGITLLRLEPARFRVTEYRD